MYEKIEQINKSQEEYFLERQTNQNNKNPLIIPHKFKEKLNKYNESLQQNNQTNNTQQPNENQIQLKFGEKIKKEDQQQSSFTPININNFNNLNYKKKVLQVQNSYKSLNIPENNQNQQEKNTNLISTKKWEYEQDAYLKLQQQFLKQEHIRKNCRNYCRSASQEDLILLENNNKSYEEQQNKEQCKNKEISVQQQLEKKDEIQNMKKSLIQYSLEQDDDDIVKNDDQNQNLENKNAFQNLPQHQDQQHSQNAEMNFSNVVKNMFKQQKQLKQFQSMRNINSDNKKYNEQSTSSNQNTIDSNKIVYTPQHQHEKFNDTSQFQPEQNKNLLILPQINKNTLFNIQYLNQSIDQQIRSYDKLQKKQDQKIKQKPEINQNQQPQQNQNINNNFQLANPDNDYMNFEQNYQKFIQSVQQRTKLNKKKLQQQNKINLQLNGQQIKDVASTNQDSSSYKKTIKKTQSQVFLYTNNNDFSDLYDYNLKTKIVNQKSLQTNENQNNCIFKSEKNDDDTIVYEYSPIHHMKHNSCDFVSTLNSTSSNHPFLPYLQQQANFQQQQDFNIIDENKPDNKKQKQQYLIEQSHKQNKTCQKNFHNFYYNNNQNNQKIISGSNQQMIDAVKISSKTKQYRQNTMGDVTYRGVQQKNCFSSIFNNIIQNNQQNYNISIIKEQKKQKSMIFQHQLQQQQQQKLQEQQNISPKNNDIIQNLLLKKPKIASFAAENNNQLNQEEIEDVDFLNQYVKKEKKQEFI